MISFLNFGKRGRLGNQLYQFVFLKTISELKKTKFKIPVENLFIRGYDGILLKNIFNISNEYFDDYDNIKKEIKFFFKEKVLPDFFLEKQYNSKYCDVIEDNSDIDGYFQSWKYFSLEKIDIVFQEWIIDIGNSFFEKECDNNHNLVSVHVRFGDLEEFFIKNNLKEYYLNSINFAKENFGYSDEDFLFFSDEPEKIKNYFGEKFRIYNNKCLGIDFYTLAKINNYIMSFSTFCMWAAILNKNRKVVICPGKKYIKNLSDINIADFYLPNTIVI